MNVFEITKKIEETEKIIEEKLQELSLTAGIKGDFWLVMLSYNFSYKFSITKDEFLLKIVYQPDEDGDEQCSHYFKFSSRTLTATEEIEALSKTVFNYITKSYIGGNLPHSDDKMENEASFNELVLIFNARVSLVKYAKDLEMGDTFVNPISGKVDELIDITPSDKVILHSSPRYEPGRSYQEIEVYQYELIEMEGI